jgi:3D (Asp-Asp-Asp) domain-containing protein
MANGQAPYVGAAAGNRWHFGTVLLVPGRGEVVVKDRIGYGSDLDLYMSSCAEAEAWGRRSLLVTQYHS